MPDPAAAPAAPGIMGTIKSKWGPLPVWGWLALVTVVILGYWLITKNKSSSATGSSAAANGPGAVGQPGVVVINQDGPDPTPAPPPTGVPIPDPGPKKKPPKPPEGSTRAITVTKDETLGDLAKQRHWSQETLQDVESMNVTEGQGKLTPTSRLKKGQEVIRPLGGG